MNGVAAAVLSSALGGMSAAVTRYVIGATDAVTLAALRFGLGALLIVPLALALAAKWPQGADRPRVAGLGVMFFCIFFVFYNVAMSLTTAARGALALSTLPLVTMIVAALLGHERLARRKSLGVLIAFCGVAIALAGGLAAAPQGAWRGDLVMMGATLIMALYSIWSRPFMQRSSMLGFLAAGMAVGGATSAVLALADGGLQRAAATFGPPQWLAVLFIAVFGGAAAFLLWVYALQHTTPTRVTNAMTVNPLAASLLAAALIGEPLPPELFAGMACVAAGIWLASSTPPGISRPARR